MKSGSRLAQGLILSVLLHALVLLAFRDYLPVRGNVSESRRTLRLEATLRPDRSSETRTDDARRLVERSRESHTTRRLAPRPAPDSAAPLPAPADPVAAQSQAPPGSDENSASRPIDLEAAGRIAGEADRSREHSLSDLPPLEPLPTERRRLGRAVAQAARPDCLDAHAGKGLFAALFLIRDTITDHGCKW